MKELTVKDVRKVAFAVGFGLTLGKATGELVGTGMNYAVKKLLADLAKNGNKYAQDICVKSNIRYEEKSEENESGIKMGFHCE